MPTISFRVSEEEEQYLREYTSANNINLSSFIRDSVLDAIEEDLKLDEKRILEAAKRIEIEESFDHTEVWDRLDV